MEERFYAQSRSTVATFFTKVFGWMGLGLGITTLVAFSVATSPKAVGMIFGSSAVLFVLMALQLGLVFGLSWKLMSMRASTALSMFLLYTAVSGLTLSSVLLVYTGASVLSAFIVAVGMFFAMAIYGAFTKTDLSPLGFFLSMALFGLLIALILNMFFSNQTFDLMTGIVGAIIFALFTAFDVQRLQRFAQQARIDDESGNRLAVIGALMLYLDFVNLLLNLLRIMGKKNR
jgi:hypothetical protein